MKPFSLAFLLTFSLWGIMAHGATHNVPPGHSIQAAINASSSGDVIILYPDTYAEDLVINGKALTMRPTSGTAQINSITIQNAPTSSRFSSIRLLTDLNASSPLILETVNVLRNVSVTDADLQALRGTNVDGNVTVTKGGIKLIKSTVHGTVTMSHAKDDSNRELEAIIVQSTVKERLVCRATRARICYSNFRDTYFEGNLEITQNLFHGRSNDYGSIGIDLNGTATVAVVRNNRVWEFKKKYDTADMSDECIGIRVTGGAKADIVNNLIYGCYDYQSAGAEPRCGMGVFVQSTSGTKILGNIIWKCWSHDASGDALVRAPNANVTMQYNLLWEGDQTRGGVINRDGIYAAPDFLNDNWHLKASSPAIDKGPPDARYNDHDGSRNDIGMYGGHSYLINGRTTDKPIPIQLSTTPAFVPIGGTVTIESTGATVK